MPITFTGGLLQFSGALTQLNIDNQISGSADFALSVTTLHVKGVVASPTTATLVMVALNNIQASGLGLAISGGPLGMRGDPAAEQYRRQRLVRGDRQQPDGHAEPRLRHHGLHRHASFQINQVEPSGKSVLNWSSDVETTGGQAYTVDPGSLLSPVQSLAITFGSQALPTGPSLTLSGTGAEFNIDNVVSGSANFAISKSNGERVVHWQLVVGGLDRCDPVPGALSNLTINAGGGGFGLTVGGNGDIGVAAILPAGSGDSRYWVAVDSIGLGGSLNLGTGISATVTSVSVMLNLAGGTGPSNNAATPLDWTNDLDLQQNGQYGKPADQVNPGAGLSPSVDLTIAYNGPELAVSGSLTSLNIFNIITGSANFASAS